MAQRKTVEHQSLPVGEFPDWLAGLLEVAGTVTLQTETVRRKGRYEYEYATPVIKMGDDNRERMSMLQQLAGGKLRQPGGHNTVEWNSKSYAAIILAELIAPFAPSRQEALTAFFNWAQIDDREERVDIASTLQQSPNRETTVTANDYKTLVKKPRFVAGIIDARATFLTPEHVDPNYPDYGWIYSAIAVASTNTPLLEAMENQFGGDIEYRLKGKMVAPGAATTSGVWRISHNRLKQLEGLVTTHLKLKSFL